MLFFGGVSVIARQNLYIVNTPLQLTTAYIIAFNNFKNDNNILVIVQPKQYHRWHKESLIKGMLDQNKVWSNIHTIVKQDIKRMSVFEIKKFIDKLKVSIQANGEVFLGNDKQFINQFLVELSGNSKYNRFDEGIGSYTPGIVKRKLKSKVSEYLLIKIMQLIFRCNQGLIYNYDGIGSGQSAVRDYLYNPAILSRYSPQVVEITDSEIQNALSNINFKNNNSFDNKEVLVYLGSSYSVFKKDITKIIDIELKMLQQIDAWAQSRGSIVLYKPHPGENSDKLIVYKNKIKNIVFYDSIEPVELICSTNNKIRCMISLFSSGMLHLNKFASQKIKTITIANIFEDQFGKPLVTEKQKEIMKICNISCPRNVEELKKIIDTI